MGFSYSRTSDRGLERSEGLYLGRPDSWYFRHIALILSVHSGRNFDCSVRLFKVEGFEANSPKTKNKLMVPIKQEIKNIALDSLCRVAETFTLRLQEYVQSKGSHLTDIVLKTLIIFIFPQKCPLVFIISV